MTLPCKHCGHDHAGIGPVCEDCLAKRDAVVRPLGEMSFEELSGEPVVPLNEVSDERNRTPAS